MGPRSGARGGRGRRVERFVDERVREVEGHETAARRIYAAYVKWADEFDCEGPLSASGFRHALERFAPIEGAVRRRHGGGRPRLYYVGVQLSASAPARTLSAGGGKP